MATASNGTRGRPRAGVICRPETGDGATFYTRARVPEASRAGLRVAVRLRCFLAPSPLTVRVKCGRSSFSPPALERPGSAPGSRGPRWFPGVRAETPDPVAAGARVAAIRADTGKFGQVNSPDGDFRRGRPARGCTRLSPHPLAGRAAASLRCEFPPQLRWVQRNRRLYGCLFERGLRLGRRCSGRQGQTEKNLEASQRSTDVVSCVQ